MDRNLKQYASEEEMLAQLDPYGTLSYTVGDEDWLAAMDFLIGLGPDGNLKVAYMVVVDCESGGFTQTMRATVAPANLAPFNLPNYWTDIWLEPGHHKEELDVPQAGQDPENQEVNAEFDTHLAENSKVNEEWNRDLQEALVAAGAPGPQTAPQRPSLFRPGSTAPKK